MGYPLLYPYTYAPIINKARVAQYTLYDIAHPCYKHGIHLYIHTHATYSATHHIIKQLYTPTHPSERHP